MKRPSAWAIVFGAIPFVPCCFTVALWDRIYPVIFGLPFNFFWLILWMFLTPVCLFVAYRIEESRNPDFDQDGRN